MSGRNKPAFARCGMPSHSLLESICQLMTIAPSPLGEATKCGVNAASDHHALNRHLQRKTVAVCTQVAEWNPDVECPSSAHRSFGQRRAVRARRVDAKVCRFGLRRRYRIPLRTIVVTRNRVVVEFAERNAPNVRRLRIRETDCALPKCALAQLHIAHVLQAEQRREHAALQVGAVGSSRSRIVDDQQVPPCRA